MISLAKIKLRIGDNEIEIDSRDFYVDNNTVGKVIADITALLQESSSRILPYSNEYNPEETLLLLIRSKTLRFMNQNLANQFLCQ